MSNTRSTRQILTVIYITVTLAVSVWPPMIKLHGYRVVGGFVLRNMVGAG